MTKQKKKSQTDDMSVVELQAGVVVLEKEIFALRNELALQRKLGQPHLLKMKRHERARLLTILTQKRSKA
jgi:ribosomal protein L29